MRTIGKSKQDVLEPFGVLAAETREAMARGDVHFDAAKAAVRRRRSLVGGVMDKDSPRTPPLRNVRNAILADPAVGSTPAMDAETAGFIKTVADGMRDHGEAP
jgi:hypothetical protein